LVLVFDDAAKTKHKNKKNFEHFFLGSSVVCTYPFLLFASIKSLKWLSPSEAIHARVEEEEEDVRRIRKSRLLH
jgi:hypothetical protein